MRVTLEASTGNLIGAEKLLKFGQTCGRVCYSEKDFGELLNEEYNSKLIERMLGSGHHSVFEHAHLTFYLDSIPKALAMFLNNERPYVTSEKSARYTQMEMLPGQKEKYDAWMNTFTPLIDKAYPQMEDSKKRDDTIKKLAQENARYMTSVFTPTKMVHTLSLRQLNQLIYLSEDFVGGYNNSRDEFKKRLAGSVEEFLSQEAIIKLKIPGLKNRTERKLSFFRNPVKEYYDDVYSHISSMSFAALGQAHRHRTIDYHISGGTQLGAPIGFYVPRIVREGGKFLEEKWENDLREIARNDFPQGQLILVSETGTIEDAYSKANLRLCGHAQHEIMRNTFELLKAYAAHVPEAEERIKPKCSRGLKCHEPCVWGPKMALERVV
jgi:thymidylate synthase (FAD)